jgi:periplasmic mercuric ion binding protein
MKTAKFILVAFIALLIAAPGSAQTQEKKATTKTEEIKVLGACGMCKTRIENAMKVPGVTEAVWTEKTQLLKVTYDPSVITKDEIQKKEAAVGHDTEKYRADDKVYAALPGCCHYERWK